MLAGVNAVRKSAEKFCRTLKLLITVISFAGSSGWH